MANNSDTGIGNYGWFRWIPVALLGTAAAIPVVYILFYYVVIKGLGPRYWDWGYMFAHSVPLAIIAVIALGAPIIGGLIALAAVPLGGFVVALMAGMSGLSKKGEIFYTVLALLLILGGILSIISGIRGWLCQRRKRGQA